MTKALFHALCNVLREYQRKYGDVYYLCIQDDVKIIDIPVGKPLGKLWMLTPDVIKLASGKTLTHKDFTSLKDIRLFCYVERCEIIRGK